MGDRKGRATLPSFISPVLVSSFESGSALPSTFHLVTHCCPVALYVMKRPCTFLPSRFGPVWKNSLDFCQSGFGTRGGLQEFLSYLDHWVFTFSYVRSCTFPCSVALGGIYLLDLGNFFWRSRAVAHFSSCCEKDIPWFSVWQRLWPGSFVNYITISLPSSQWLIFEGRDSA